METLPSAGGTADDSMRLQRTAVAGARRTPRYAVARRRGRAMTDRILHAAVCEACGTAFRVPSPDRTYSCKKCAGVVRAVAAPAGDPEDVCASCRAVLPRDTRFCPEC